MSWKEWLLLIGILCIALFSVYGLELQFIYEVTLFQVLCIILLCFASGCAIGLLLYWSYTRATRTLTNSIITALKNFSTEKEKEEEEDGEVEVKEWKGSLP